MYKIDNLKRFKNYIEHLYIALDKGETFLESLKQQKQDIGFNLGELDEAMYQLDDLYIAIKDIVRKTNVNRILEQQTVNNTCKNVIRLNLNIDDDKWVNSEENIADIFKQPTDQ